MNERPSMEKWIDVYEGVIPKDNYIIEINWGRKVIANLIGNAYNIKIEFEGEPIIHCMDESDMLGEGYNEKEIERLKKCRYKNTIYKINNGEYKRYVQKHIGNTEKYDSYIIVTENYFIEIMTNSKIIITNIDEG